MRKSLIYRHPASHPAEQLQVQCCRDINPEGGAWCFTCGEPRILPPNEAVHPWLGTVE